MKKVLNVDFEAGPRIGGPFLFGDCFMHLLANSSSPLFCGIRQQLASGRLPNLAQHLGAMATKAGKEVVAL